MVLPAAVFAEERQAIEEIVVTAQKRAENSQDVPLTLTTFSDDFLAAANIHTLGNLSAFAPGFATELSSRTQPQLYIRGLGTNDFGIGSDPSVGVYLDGNALPYAPDRTFSFTAEYEQFYSAQGSIIYRIDFAYTGEKFFYVENNPLESQGGVSVTNLRMSYLPAQKSWEVSVYANNAFNKEYATLKGGLGREIDSPTIRRADPQLIGIEGKYRF